MHNRSLSGSHNGTKPAATNAYNNTYTGSNGWIEREIYNIKKSYEEEIKLLEVRGPYILKLLCVLDFT